MSEDAYRAILWGCASVILFVIAIAIAVAGSNV